MEGKHLVLKTNNESLESRVGTVSQYSLEFKQEKMENSDMLWIELKNSLDVGLFCIKQHLKATLLGIGDEP